MDDDAVDELTEEITSLVYSLGHSWDAFWDARVRELDVGLTGRQATALWMTREPLSMGELSTRMSCDPSSATGIVDRLERKGLVTRAADENDRRAKRVQLTPEGRRLLRRIERTVMASRPSIAALTDAERRDLRDLLTKAMKGLE